MNKFKVLRILYPGLFAVKPFTIIDFVESDDKFYFVINDVSKGLVVHDPFNRIVKRNNSFSISSEIFTPREPSYVLTPQGDNMDIEFSGITEVNPRQARTYAEQPYTELFLVLIKYDLVMTIELLRHYLLKLFVRYNSSVLHSTLLRPDESHWEESIVVLECVFEQKDTFETLVSNGFDFNLDFKPSLVYMGLSRYGILPKRVDFVDKKSKLLAIPAEFSDVFDLFASGVMQLNFYKNHKIALLECFVAVEILVVRITNEVQKKRVFLMRKLANLSKLLIWHIGWMCF
jgi:hypothetical protein